MDCFGDAARDVIASRHDPATLGQQRAFSESCEPTAARQYVARSKPDAVPAAQEYNSSERGEIHAIDGGHAAPARDRAFIDLAARIARYPKRARSVRWKRAVYPGAGSGGHWTPERHKIVAGSLPAMFCGTEKQVFGALSQDHHGRTIVG
jgi:hypothetical protein